jgi:dipeptidase E
MGGLSWEGAEWRLLEDYLLGLAGAKRPRLLFVPTAAADDPRSTLWIYTQLGDRAELSHVSFFPWPPPGLRTLALEQDVIFVSGGNTANALAIWRTHGFDKILREAWESGVVLTGWSAGMLCWFEAAVTDSFGPELQGSPSGSRAPSSPRPSAPAPERGPTGSRVTARSRLSRACSGS